MRATPVAVSKPARTAAGKGLAPTMAWRRLLMSAFTGDAASLA